MKPIFVLTILTTYFTNCEVEVVNYIHKKRKHAMSMLEALADEQEAIFEGLAVPFNIELDFDENVTGGKARYDGIPTSFLFENQAGLKVLLQVYTNVLLEGE